MVCTNLKAQHKHPLIYGSCCTILILLSLQIFHYKNLKLEHEGVVCKRQRGMNNFSMFNSDKVMCQQGWWVTIPIVDIINVKLIRCVLHFIARKCDDCLCKMQFSLSRGRKTFQQRSYSISTSAFIKRLAIMALQCFSIYIVNP